MEVRIKLKIKDVEIELDLREIKELKKILADITEKEHIPDYPYIHPYSDYPWTVTWGTGTSTDSTIYTVFYGG